MGEGKYCNKNCYYASKKGIVPPQINNKGKRPWIAGRKGYIKSWAKGLTANDDPRIARFVEGGKVTRFQKTGRVRLLETDPLGYKSLHKRISKRFGTPKECLHCKTTDPALRYEWANISKDYKEDRSDWIRLCKRCHSIYDRTGRG